MYLVQLALHLRLKHMLIMCDCRRGYGFRGGIGHSYSKGCDQHDNSSRFNVDCQHTSQQKWNAKENKGKLVHH